MVAWSSPSKGGWGGGKGGGCAKGGGKGKSYGGDYGGGQSYGGNYGGGYRPKGGSYGGNYGGSATDKAVQSLVWMEDKNSIGRWKLRIKSGKRRSNVLRGRRRRRRRSSVGKKWTLLRIFCEHSRRLSVQHWRSKPRRWWVRRRSGSLAAESEKLSLYAWRAIEEEADYKALLRKKPRKQKATPPVDVTRWLEWECNGTDATLIKKTFAKTKLKATDFKGKALMDIAESLETDQGLGSKEELAEMYKKAKKKSAPARWARVDILVGLVANAVSDE